MGEWLRRVALFLLLIGPITASAIAPPSVLQAIPGTDGGDIARFTLRFSEPMVPLGKGGADPITMNCPVGGSGRWSDASTYIWEFEHPLSGGMICHAALKPGLKTASGRLLAGQRSFDIDSGGPYARAVLPNEDGGGEIEEDQTFFVAANGPVDRASVAAQAYCAVDGIGERIPVDLLPQSAVMKVLGQMSDHWQANAFVTDGGAKVLIEAFGAWQRGDFLQDSGNDPRLPADAKARAAALANIVALKCRRPLPPGHDMSLVWPGTIRSPSGHLAGEGKRFDFTVRKEFAARLTCSRVNADAGCDPVEEIKVEFSAPVPRAQALAARLDVGGGRILKPVDEGHDATLSTVKFKPPFAPGITAKLLLPADLKDESGRVLVNARRFPLDFAIAEAPPLVKFAAPFGILEAKEGGVLPVTVRAVEPVLVNGQATIAGGTARIEANDGAIAEWLRRVEEAQEADFESVGEGKNKHWVNHTGDKPLFTGHDPVQRTQLALPGGGKEFEVIGMPLGRPGFYVVELASPTLGRALLGRPATRYVDAAALVTNMAVHFKWGRAGSLVWVTALDTGKPVPGAAVRVTDSCTGRQLTAGTTDGQGRLMLTSGLPEPTTGNRCNDLGDRDSPPLMVSARLGDDFSFVLSSWGQGIQPYDFDLQFGYSAPEPRLHAILDRTLMKAGETAHMTFVYRQQTPQGFRSAGALKGSAVFTHDGSGDSFEVPVDIGDDGMGEVQWTAPRGAPAGSYSISVKADDRSVSTGQSIRVEEYRLPTMRASVEGPRTRLVRPKTLPLDLYVGYLSGGGSMHAPVKLRSAVEYQSEDVDGWDGWFFGGAPVHEGTVPLDEEDSEAAQDQTPDATTIPLTLDAHGALRTSIDVPAIDRPAQMRVEMDYQDADGETLTASTVVPIESSAVRLGIKPDGWIQRADALHLQVVALDLDGRRIRHQRIQVALYTREILSARRRLIGGFYAFDNTARTTRIRANCSGETDNQGLLDCRLDPAVSGEVIAVATTTDRMGNEARSVHSVYLAGDDDWWFGGDNGDRMDIIPDAKSYEPGQTAKVQVRMPFREATALVTVEREGVLSSFVTELSGDDPVVKVPMAGVYAPDAYISVMAVRGRVANWRLWLADFAKRWHLPFFNQENPTALVDLAKPAYRIGIVKVKVGWKAHQLNVAVRADKDHYQVRDKAHVSIRVRGPDGKAPQSAEVAFAAVDDALLQLSPNDSWNLLDDMMEERPLSVLTSTAQMQVVGKRHYGRKALATGGGGGGDMSALARSDFRPVLLWRGRLKLDANGEASLDVPMADSLSSYKLVAVATAGEDLFGTGSATVRTVQDLSIYSGVPPLVRSGDSYDATFTLRNGTAKAMTVTATADLQPAVAQGGPVTVTIQPGGAVPVTWHLIAPEHVDQLRWTVTARAKDGRSADRLQVDEQVVPAIPEETWAATFFRIGESPAIPVGPPAGALPGGHVLVALSATPAPPLVGVQDYMRRYPYGCFEQRLSRAIVLGDKAAWARQLDELPTYTTSDGLLRFWPSEYLNGSIWLTSYALSSTKEAGLDWPQDDKEKLLQAMKGVVDGRIKQEGDGPNDMRLLRLDALATLARYGRATPAMVAQARIPLTDMPTSTLADWLMTLDRTPGVAQTAKLAAEKELRSRILYEGTRFDLVDRRRAPWWMMVSEDYMAMKAMLAVIGRLGWQQDVPKMMIGIARRQEYGHWDTTPANAWGTIAVHRFAAAYPSPVGGTTTARFAGTTLQQLFGQAEPMVLPLPPAPTPLILTHSTTPAPWATVSVRAAVPLKEPAFAGYRISRQVSFLQRQTPGKITRGDVIKIRIIVDAPVDRVWVVIDDPIPAGSSIVSRGGTQPSLIADRAEGGTWWPTYVERGFDAWRGYFDWFPKGRTSVEYAVRINAAGTFKLPPTRVEAMYSPEIHAAIPNAPMVVSQ